MSLIDGLILSTLNKVGVDSNHSLLTRFYSLDRQIAEWYENKSYKECFHSLELHFMEIEARSILKALDII